MTRLIPFNRTGIVGLETIGVQVSGNALIYTFEAHPYVNTPFNGLLIIHFKQSAPAEASGTMPIYFETQGVSGSRKPVTKAGGQPLTASDISVPSYNLFFYDFRTGIVEAVAGVTNQPTNKTK